MDGHNQWNTINKGTASARKVILHNIDILRPRLGKPAFNDTLDTSVRAAIRVGHYKLITGDCGDDMWLTPRGVPNKNLDAGLLSDTEKAIGRREEEIRRNQDKNFWLFNVREHPNEYHDLSESQPEKVRELLDQLLAINETAVPPFIVKGDPRSDRPCTEMSGGPWLDLKLKLH